VVCGQSCGRVKRRAGDGVNAFISASTDRRFCTSWAERPRKRPSIAAAARPPGSPPRRPTRTPSSAPDGSLSESPTASCCDHRENPRSLDRHISPGRPYGSRLSRRRRSPCSARRVCRWGFRFRDHGAAPAMAVRSLRPPTTMSSRLAIGHYWQSTLQKEGEPDVKPKGGLHHDHHRSLRPDGLKPC
jgi:hypothetical protein